VKLEIVDIELIKYSSRRRIRKDLGDLSALKESIQKYGLFYPLIVTPDLELLAGQRRLESVKSLGWEKVPVIILNPKGNLQKLEIEVEENIVRKDFTQEEIEEMVRRKQSLLQKNIFKKIWYLIKELIRWIKEKLKSS